MIIALKIVLNCILLKDITSFYTNLLYFITILGGWAVDYCGGYKGAKQRVTALKMCSVFGK